MTQNEMVGKMRIWDLINSSDGFTLSADSELITTDRLGRYAVAIGGFRITNEMEAERYHKLLANMATAIYCPSGTVGAIGLWDDPDGQKWLELVLLCSDFVTADNLKDIFGQCSIYDLRLQKEV